MIFNPDLTQPKQRLTAILVANLTPSQLDEVQAKFGDGANLLSPYPTQQLFIEDKKSWSSYSHAEMRRSIPDPSALIVIDAKTPNDGGIWYLADFATEDEVNDGEAENTDTLFKIRMRIEDIVITFENYAIANQSIREDMDSVDIPYPTPQDFDSSAQSAVFSSGFDCFEDRYLSPTWVTATPDEVDESTDPDVLDDFSPRPKCVYRLKDEVAMVNGLQGRWTFGTEAEDRKLPDGTVMKFPEGSLVLQCDYERDFEGPKYERPEGSL